jgi:hypothetical protein
VAEEHVLIPPQKSDVEVVVPTSVAPEEEIERVGFVNTVMAICRGIASGAREA